MMGAEKSRLPKEYHEVEYLESTGTQYIDTGYIFTSYLQKAFIEIQITRTDASPQRIMGAYDGANRSLLTTITTVNGIYAQFGTGLNYINVVTGVFDLNRHTLQIELNNNKGYLTIDGVQESGVLPSPPSHTDTRVHLFHSNGNVQYLYAKIYSCKLFENEILVRNFVPCYRKVDRIPGMYDLCGSICSLTNSPFYINAGTGEFIVGPKV